MSRSALTERAWRHTSGSPTTADESDTGAPRQRDPRRPGIDLPVAIAGGQAEQIGRPFVDEPDPVLAGERNWRHTVAGAEVYGALWFELATHAMRQEPYAAGLADVMVAAQLREFTRIYARLTTPAKAARLARLTVAVGQGLIFDLLIDRDRRAADAAVREFSRMVRRELDGGVIRDECR